MIRSSKDLLNLAIVASDSAIDSEIGDVKDLYFDDDTWTIRYLVVDLMQDALKQAPWYDPALPLTRDMEVAIYKHYGVAEYWFDAAL